MRLCATCGLEDDSNRVHASEFKGIGKHAFLPADDSSGPEDTLDLSTLDVVYAGGELKSTGKGTFEGYLVRFSSAEDPDLVGDYFTKNTEFYIPDGARIPVIYDHGLNKTLKGRKIGEATVSYTDAGVFIKGELALRDEYEKLINKKLVMAHKAGLSSGAARHLVERKEIKSGVHEITAWCIAEGSITVAPTEPRCTVTPLKSYAASRVDPFAEEVDELDGIKTVKKEKVDGVYKYVLYSNDGSKKLGTHDSVAEALAQEKAINKQKKSITEGEDDGTEDDRADQLAVTVKRNLKGLFQTKMEEKTRSIWDVRQVLDEVLRDIACACATTDITGVPINIEAVVKEAIDEYASYLLPLAVGQITQWAEKSGDGENGRFYLRSLEESALLSIGADLGSNDAFNEHSETVGSVVGEYAQSGAHVVKGVNDYLDRCERRLKARVEDPLKAGRVLSASTVEKLTAIKQAIASLVQELGSSHEKLDTLMASATPKKSVDTGLLAREFALTQTETELALLGIK